MNIFVSEFRDRLQTLNVEERRDAYMAMYTWSAPGSYFKGLQTKTSIKKCAKIPVATLKNLHIVGYLIKALKTKSEIPLNLRKKQTIRHVLGTDRKEV